MATLAEAVTPNNDGKIIGLISAGHFFSHFYMLLLPPLFPLLKDIYGVGYTELGFAITVFSITTAISQAPVGFLVDRYGACKLLVAGILLESVAIGSIGFFPVYSALLALMIAAGLANAVYHPADYSILNSVINDTRMGRAFSIHTFAGLLGDALAPVTVIFLIALFDWRIALLCCGAIGVMCALMIAGNASLLYVPKHEQQLPSGANSGHQTGWRLLFSPPILLGLLFFLGIAVSTGGIRSFGISTLNALHNTPITTASLIISAYLFASPVGVLIGGWIADRTSRHNLVAATCFVLVAVLVLIIAAVEMPLAVTTIFFGIAGLCAGIVAPSRDMMIRSVTPPGQAGKVFGFVSTGFNLGGIIGPVFFGYLLDNTDPSYVFWAVAILSLLTVLTVLHRPPTKNYAS